MTERRYSLPEPLLQAVVNVLNDLPARVSRPLLNGIEVECAAQDAQEAQQREAISRAVQASGRGGRRAGKAGSP